MDDRLSSLPESLILHILSFLPTRDVVKTTLLSKRWENLWTTLPCLNFFDSISEYDEPYSHRFRNFVNQALLCWKGTKILKFIIEYGRSFDKSLTGDMNFWVHFAVGNKVEELNIHLMYTSVAMEREEAVMSGRKDVYMAPQCLYSCSSIRKLSLVGCYLQIHRPPAWDQLKSLRIHGFYLSEHLIKQILLGTPQLEVFDLRLVESNKNLNIFSASLKMLKIEKYVYFWGARPPVNAVLMINCPNLETLEISGGFYNKCLFTDVSSLTNVTLDFNDDNRYYHACGIKLLGEAMRHVFSTFQHV
ncbi:hypothetical protein ACS0TY_008684 [Phlomoides rotata]